MISDSDSTLPNALQAFRAGCFDDARRFCQQRLVEDPGCTTTLHLLGSIAAHQNDDDSALELFDEVIRREPKHASARADRAMLYERQQRLDLAEQDYRAAIELNADFFEATHNLAVILRRQERFAESLSLSQRTIELRPNSAMAQFHHALNAELNADIQLALACYDRALKIQPEFEEARANRALCKLLLGQFHDAWEDYAYRDQYRLSEIFPRQLVEQLQDVPHWAGQPLAGKRLLVYGDQGIGDEILFASIFTELLEQGCRLTVICDPRLQAIFARSFPSAVILGQTLGKDQPIVGLPDDIDYQVPSGHLPRTLRLHADDFANRRSPYLLPDADQVARWRARFDERGPGVKVGISWRAGGGSKTRDRRTTQLTQWAPLLSLPHVQYIDLQYGETVEERAELHESHGLTLHHFPDADPLLDMDGFASKMAACDYVISVGNATVHTAGALGVDTFALLPKVPIWRWMMHGDRSIWYPSVEMARQQQWYAWEPIIAQATGWLVERLQQRGFSGGASVEFVANEANEASSDIASRLGDPLRVASPEEMFAEAQQLHQAEGFAGAEQLYLRIVKNAPRHADAWNLAGVAAHQQGRHPIAVERIRRAIEMQPEQPVYYFNLACVEVALGQRQDAIQTYRRLAELAPEMIEVHHNLGALLAEQGDLNEAITAYDRVLKIEPASVITHVKLGLALREQGQMQAADEAFRIALHHDPNCQPAADALRQSTKPAAASASELAVESQQAEPAKAPPTDSAKIAWLLAEAIRVYNQNEFEQVRPLITRVLEMDPCEINALRLLGVIERRTGHADRAIEILSRAIELAPLSAELHFELGSSYRLDDQLELSYKHYLRATELDPSLQPAFVNVGAILEDWERFEEALPLQQTAVRLNPNCSSARYNLGNCLMKTGQVEESIAQYDQAIALAPTYDRAHWNRCISHLLLGDFNEGFGNFEYRTRVGEIDIDAYPQPRWQGESLAGKTIVIHAEQGIGDEILFASCFEEVIALAERCVIVCEPRLEPLFRRTFSGAIVHGIARRGDFSAPELEESIDYQIPMGSLPVLLRRNEADFPQGESYLAVDPAAQQWWRQKFDRLGPGLKIGISWRTGGKPVDRRKRTTELAQWKQLLQMPGVDWINLQYGDVETELAQAASELGVTIHDFTDADPLIDMDGFAAKVSAVDLVISVGNATVHLAGALGVESWCLLPIVPSWRWMLRTERTPWYPTVSLYRQPTRGDWRPVFEQIATRLRNRLNLKMEQMTEMNPPEVLPASLPAVTTGIDPSRDLISKDEIPKLLARGMSYHQAGKYSLAEETYRKILEHAPRHIDALQLLGTLASQTGRAALAIRSIRRALSVNNHNPGLHYNLANTLAGQGDLDKAIEHYEIAIDQQQEFPEALLNLGVALGRKQDFVAARECYERALAVKPGYIDAINNLALLDRSA